MRYRKLAQPTGTNVFNSTGGDYAFGHGSADFWINVPDAPAQAALTRMYLFLGDWFLDTSDGMPWNTKVLGHYTANTRDPAIQSRILGTQGIKAIRSYSSNVVRDTRAFTVNAQLDTIYGAAVIQGAAQMPIPIDLADLVVSPLTDLSNAPLTGLL